MKIDGRRVLLTGATGGLGQAIARELHSRGADLVLTGRRLEVLEPLAQELNAQALPTDLSQPEGVDQVLAGCGRVDILVANAGLSASGDVREYTTEQINRALDVNLRSPLLLAKELCQPMVARGEGHVVFISSLSGKVATAGSALYSATKFGLRGFSAGLREDLHGTGVGVSAVFPTAIAEAGMFADSGAELPISVGKRTPAHVAAAVVRAIERNRREIDVVSPPERLWTFAGAVAPRALAAVNRRFGAGDVAAAIAEGHRHKR